jgi:hypothetical protein
MGLYTGTKWMVACQIDRVMGARIPTATIAIPIFAMRGSFTKFPIVQVFIESSIVARLRRSARHGEKVEQVVARRRRNRLTVETRSA